MAQFVHVPYSETEHADARFQAPEGHPVRSVFIASICPLELPPRQLQRYVGFENFSIKSMKRGEWEVIEVRETYNWIPNPSAVSETETVMRLSMVSVPAIVRAESLVNIWRNISMSTIYGGSIGIKMIPVGMKFPVEEKGELISDDEFEGFRKFLDELSKEQAACFRGLMQQANDYAGKGRASEIQPFHFAAAEWMLGDNAKSLSWYKIRNQEVLKLKRCVACNEEIDVSALRCKHCSQDLIKWYTEYNVDPENDLAVASMIEKIKSRTKGAVTSISELPLPDYGNTRKPRINAKGEPIISRFYPGERKAAVKLASANGISLNEALLKIARDEAKAEEIAIDEIEDKLASERIPANGQEVEAE